MSLYARLTLEGQFDRLVELTPEQYASLQANGKAAWLRTWVEEPKPTPGDGEVVEATQVVVTETEARQGWVVRAMTASELAFSENEAERVRLRTVIANLAGSVQAPDTAGTAVERLAKLEARTLRLERICLWVLRRFT